MQYLITNGIIVDGSGAPPYRGEIRIADGRICRVGVRVEPLPGDSRLDAGGRWVAPGFIDCHSHSDLAIMEEGGLDPKILQGVTTEVSGQCGLSVFPLPREHRPAWRSISVIGNPAFDWGWNSAADWIRALSSRPLALNLRPFIGAGTLRYGIAGDSPAPLGREGLVRYREALEEGFAAGIGGLSFGLIYLPAMFSTRDELELAARTAARYGRPLAVHVRSESDELEAAVREMIDLAEQTGVRLHLSHLKAIGRRNNVQLEAVLGLIERYGLDFDHYPYTWGSTSLLSLVPPWLLREGVDVLLRRLAEPGLIDELEQLWSGKLPVQPGAPWDNLPELVGWENIRITGAAHGAADDCLGVPLDQAAAKRAVSPAGLVCQVLRDAAGDVRMLDEYTQEEMVMRILCHPAGCIASDSLFGPGAHPRVSGCFPRVFQRYVFERNLIRIEDAVRKMTAGPAAWLGLADRGLIREGLQADLVVFGSDMAESVSGGSPQGIHAVMVNGALVVLDGRLTGERGAGRLALEGVTG